MLQQTRVLDYLDDDVDGICASQTPAEAGYLDIDGDLAVDGEVTLETAQIVTITTVSDETAVTFTVTGTTADGIEQSEDIAGVDTSTAKSVYFYKTITSVYVDAGTDDAITVGVLSADSGVSKMIVCDYRSLTDFNVGMGLNIDGTLSATVQHCGDNIFDTSIQPTWINCLGLTAVTSNDVGNIAFAVRGVRLKLNSWTEGSATLNYVQAG